LYYPGIWLCYNTLSLYPVSSLCGHLPVVKDERKLQTFGSKSGRSRLQAVSNIKWFDCETFGIKLEESELVTRGSTVIILKS